MRIQKPTFPSISYFAIPGLEIGNILDQIQPLGKISTLKIMNLIAFATGITIEQMKSKTRKREIKEARQLFHCFCKKYTTLSLAVIGSYTGNDHATVKHSVNVVNNLRETEKVYMSKYDRIRILIKSELNKIDKPELV